MSGLTRFLTALAYSRYISTLPTTLNLQAWWLTSALSKVSGRQLEIGLPILGGQYASVECLAATSCSVLRLQGMLLST